MTRLLLSTAPSSVDTLSSWSRSLRLLAACIVGCFVLTCLGLYVCLESIDQSDLRMMQSRVGGNSDTSSGLFLTSMRRVTRESSQQQHQPHLKGAAMAAERLMPPISSTSSYVSRRGTSSKMTRRQLFERDYPPDDLERIRRNVQTLRVPDPGVMSHNDFDYNISDCPDTPSVNYPLHWKLTDILQAWNPDDTAIPSKIYNSLCLFNSATDQAKIKAYRTAEVPFVVRDHADILRTTERWNSRDGDYLLDLVGANIAQRNEYSRTNHFMFWRTRGLRQHEIPADWTPPTELVSLSLAEWMHKAKAVMAQQQQDGSDKDTMANRKQQQHQHDYSQTNQEHWYFRLNAAFESVNYYLYDELPIFRPDQGSTLFMVDPAEERGINCRFGMKGVIAESHFDPTRNWVVVLGGQRRYILSHPRECLHMELYPLGHPSGRHSALDWSNVPKDHSGPLAHAAMAQEVVLQPGDALYLPTSWFHYIVSLNTNYQCNARSGATTENHHFLHECGFPV